MTWASIHQSHAVERVRVEVHFAENLPKKYVELLGQTFDRLDSLRFGERTEHRSTTLMFAINPGQPDPQPNVQVGWMATRVATKRNLPLEAIIVTPSALVYESSDYRGWATAFERFNSVTFELLTEAGKIVNSRAVALDYVDRFFFSGEPRKAVPTDVISPDLLGQLPSSVLSGEELWHLHRGWFERVNGDLYLANQNFDAQDGVTELGKPARSIQILTKLEYRPDPESIELLSIPPKLEAMHTHCNKLVEDCLTIEMARKIGLRRD